MTREVSDNGVEHVDEGSVLAAVGTALPETMIPIVAILGAVFAGRNPHSAREIGIGAILGIRDWHLLVGGLYYALFVVAAVPTVVS